MKWLAFAVGALVALTAPPLVVEGKTFSEFEPYNRLALNDRPQQYSRKPKDRSIFEYLNQGQKQAYAKR
jgi:hypothetical protein